MSSSDHTGRVTLQSTWRGVALVSILWGSTALAESQVQTKVQEVTVERDHHTMWVLDSLGMSAESGDRTTIRLELDGLEQERLASYGIRILRRDPLPPRPVFKTKNSPGYNTPDTVNQALEAIATSFPDIARTSVLGYSVEGRPIVALVLSDNVQTREADEPSMRVLGAHHGDEWSSMEVPLAVAQRMAEDYTTREDIRATLDQYEVWFVPVVNPDGILEYSRRNANNVDLNRNYGLTWTNGLGRGPYPFSEPETAAMRALGFQRSFHHSISMHSGATNLGWVWNHTLERSLDEAFLEDVSERYQDINTTRNFWITNGADWYMVTGDTNDWSYGARGGQDYTLELTSRKAPAANSIETYVEEHLEAIIQFLVSDGQRGRRGRVVDPAGRGIEASLTLLNESGDAVSGFTLSDPSHGAFHRLGFEDTYRLLVEAEGFTSQQLAIDLTSVNAAEPLRIEVTPLEDFALNITTPLIFGHDQVTPCIQTTPPLPAGYGLGIYRFGNEVPLHQLEMTDTEDCLELRLPYQGIPLWEDDGAWHLVVLNDAGEIVRRFDEAVTLITLEATAAPSIRSVEFEDGLLSLQLEAISNEFSSRDELIVVAPDSSRQTLTYSIVDDTFSAAVLTPQPGIWHVRIHYQGATWASQIECSDDTVFTVLPPLNPENTVNPDDDPSDASEPSDQSDPSDTADSSDASDASQTNEDPSGAETTDPSQDDAMTPEDAPRTSSESSGCHSAPSSAFAMFLPLLVARLRRRPKVQAR